MNTLLSVAVAALATARLTRLVTRDQILAGPRRRVLRRLPEDGLLAYGLVCDWCVSMYIGAAVAAGGALGGVWTWWQMPFLALAFSYVTGWLASKEGE